MRKQSWLAFLLLVPALFALILLRIAPALKATIEALRDPSGQMSLAPLTTALQDPVFIESVKVTLLFIAILVPTEVITAMGLALLFNGPIVGTRLFRGLVFLPVVVPHTVSAVIWGMLMRPDGPLTNLIDLFFGYRPTFLTNENTALISIVVIVMWVNVGYWMVFLLAGIRDIPQSVIEAAKVDGAGAVRRFSSIMLPLLRRPIAFVVIANTAQSFLVFSPVRILTRGGPNGSTNLLMHHIFDLGYGRGNYSAAGAATLVLLFIVFTIVVLQFRLMRESE